MFNFPIQKFNNFLDFKFEYFVIISFVLYCTFYYFSCESTVVKPDFKTVLLVLGFHVGHMMFIKNLHDKGQTAFAALIIIIPMLLYKIYSIYQRKQQEEYQRKMNLMMAQFQALQQAQQNQQQGGQQGGQQNNQQYNEFNRSMQLNPNSPQNQGTTVQTTLPNPKQHHYNELNRTLQVTQNGNQCQNGGIQTKITQNYRPQLETRSININGQSESQFLEDTIRQEDFSPNYNAIQSGAIIETLGTGGGVNAFDDNNYLTPAYESLF
ncbi:uncharacterized protein METZ01_LOCUS85030 [marine metagenome]|uniref:Transmembrane protein n=1 Tax=marine metagenome TaxID=408172 RepID=A0A381UVL8_9ZZZZ